MELVLDLPVVRAPWRLRPVVPSRTDDLGIADVVSEIALGDSRPAQLTVTRKADDDLQDRQVYLRLDGEEWATIYYGQTITREIPPGRHALKADNTLFRKTVEFDARPGEHVRFRCINRPHWTLMLFMAVLGAAIVTVVLERDTDVVPAAKPDGPKRS